MGLPSKIKMKCSEFRTNKEDYVMQSICPDLNIGSTIQKLRIEKNFTQEQIVAKMQVMNIEISRGTYAKLETNRRNIKLSELVALTVILDVDFNTLFADIAESTR
jgi:transcriptional regulator with XRE-family HTH domain